MNRHSYRTSALTISAAILAIPAFASAAPIELRRDAVVPVVFEEGLSIRGNRIGDRFTARVDDTYYLPSGTKFEGRIAGIREARGKDPAMMDLEFTDILMPDGQRHRVDAVPIPLNDRFVTRDRDGRFTAKKDTQRKTNSVIGGAVGGFILGSIFQKQMEGVMLGTIAGIIIAETGKGNDGNVVINRGTRMGALINREVRFDWRGNGNYDRRDDNWGRYDDRRDDDWGRYDDRRDDRWDNRWDGREPVVTYRNRDLRWDREKPYRIGSTVMVPLERAVSQLDLRFSRDNRRDNDRWYDGRDDRRYDDRSDRYGYGSNRTLFVEGNGGYLEFEVGSRRARLNNRSIEMPQAAVERDRVVYVPIDVLGQLTRENIFINGTRIPTQRF